jgi:iron complex outermembrane receptor protein
MKVALAAGLRARRRVLRSIMQIGSSLAALGWTAAAQAQSDASKQPSAPTSATTTSQTTPAPNAGTPQASERDDQLGDIVVTAQRRSENVQNVPISIAVVSGDALQASGFRQITDIQYLATGVQYDPAGGSGFQVRGIGTQVFDYSNEQAVGTVIDDIVYDLPRNPGLANLADIDRVEVLRGPQGTLFGKNSSSGVVSVTTKKPELGVFSGDFYGSYGSRNDVRATGVINIPLGEIAAVRLAVTHVGQNGFYSNPYLGTRLGDIRENGVRAKLRVEPNDRFDATAIFDYSKHYDKNAIGALTSATPAATGASANFGVVVGPSNTAIATETLPYADYTNLGGSLTLRYSLGDHTLTSVTGYRDLAYRINGPVGPDPQTQFAPINFGVIDAHKFSQEVRLASPARGLFQYVVGLYYNEFHLFSTQEQAGKLGATLPPGVFLSTVNGKALFHNDSFSKAIFANVTVAPTTRLRLVFGGRLTNDVNKSQFGYDSSSLSYVYIPVAPIPTPPNGRTDATNFSFKVSPSYQITPDVLAYATYSTGYKGPGVAFVSGIRSPYQAETVKNYELGIKSELFDRRLRVNITAFDEEFTNFQAQVRVLVASGLAFIIQNAGGLRARGVEGEINWKVSRYLQANGGITYSDTVFTNYIRGALNLAGYPLTNAPKWSLTGGLTYAKPIDDRYSVNASVNAAYRTMTYQQLADPLTIQPGYAIVNGQLSITSIAPKLEVGIYARNLFDQEFYVSSNDLPFGVFQRIPNDGRRTVGVFVRGGF